MPYPLNENALETWAATDLERVGFDGRRHEFLFRYEGSTCQYGGIPILAEMRATIEDHAGRLVLREFDVRPAPGDKGFPETCAGGHGHIAAQLVEMQLLDQPIDAILDREWAVIPAGCFCDGSKIFHKVLVTLGSIRCWFQTQAA